MFLYYYLLLGLILVLVGLFLIGLISFNKNTLNFKDPPKQETPALQPYVICDKHPGHKTFIRSPAFKMKDLPDGYRRQDLLDFIQTFSGLVVKIVVITESKFRPKLEASKDVYGEGEYRCGSGLLWNAQICHWNANTRCRCADCLKSTDPVMQWGQLCVCTANHVVWDNIEAAGATVDLYFDGTKAASVKLMGLKVIRRDAESDSCEMSVVTHSKAVYEKILSDIEKCYETTREPSEHEKLTLLQGGDYLAIIISHPHGMEKMISIGRTKRRNADHGSKTGIVPVSYIYDTPTCPGSSGAPVLLVGLEKITISFPPHCGSRKRNRNYSGSGIELDRAKERMSPFLFIYRNKNFDKRQKIIKVWRLWKVYLRKLSTFTSSFVSQLPKKKFRKPTKKIIQKLLQRTALKNKEIDQFHPTLMKAADDTSLTCKNKNEHSHFLPKRNFTINSLPEPFQDEDILNTILQLCDLTGLIVLSSDPFTCFILYLDYDRRFKNSKKDKCPCPECRQSKNPKKGWMSFVARTSSSCARYQNNGLLSAKCLFYYDDQTQMDKYLYVYKVIKRDNVMKSLDIILVTHDIEVGRKILKTLEEFLKSATKLSKRFESSEYHNMTVIPCHPHGSSKCICIGQHPSGSTGDSALCHQFQAATCSGSVGAPVCTLLNGQTLVDFSINQAFN